VVGKHGSPSARVPEAVSGNRSEMTSPAAQAAARSSEAGRVLDDGMGLRIKRTVQAGLRLAHLPLVRSLPARVAIYFHATGSDERRALRRIAQYYHGCGYTFVSPDRYLAPGPDRRIFLSFDDTSRSWLDALGILDEEGVIATFYLDTAGIVGEWGAPDGRDPERCLHVDEVRRLADAGHRIGVHTHSHPNLGTMDVPAALAEVDRSRYQLSSAVGVDARDFAVPFGMPRNLPEGGVDALLAAGYRSVAFATPGMQFARLVPGVIQRSPWDATRPFEWNQRNLRTDGRVFVRLTGRSPIG